ncbi:TetR family transcriptional regulator [Nocardia tenerifensis]|uniref:TetR family transcriptional regulator n=1 Tax=Nocardia tenerifensis TaxID=228006 RepID=A0A318L048_9NOCA|nr:TetR/AcrR family transcriptional regulator [Nocardia tenerifensis]PXX71494.1 TetR family transcriptional regulator [Nocardia tenerifensis]
MGHREDLLVGAKRCLIEIGYARTTSRDIVAASNTNLASIVYHYGSKEALLNVALIEAVKDSAKGLGRTLNTEMPPDASPIERFEAIWSSLVEQFTAQRQIWLASFEVFAQVDRVPEVREALAAAIQDGREGMVRMFQAITGQDQADLDEPTVRAMGSFFQALATGVMSQWLVEPERAPSGQDLANALRLMVSLTAPTLTPGASSGH